ncbi:hypothetical protein D9619_008885 [Psilocybe cf. subviscida]|uniref:Uncharacterized protein n=1 Tax=Psilocybe cf. subviscida TaxID=2480587 RepID=A0A8H5BCI0_9AGAR|nr:hypothetical protein D9619_008885 [Psilocybe cf. subviscida]
MLTSSNLALVAPLVARRPCCSPTPTVLPAPHSDVDIDEQQISMFAPSHAVIDAAVSRLLPTNSSGGSTLRRSISVLRCLPCQRSPTSLNTAIFYAALRNDFTLAPFHPGAPHLVDAASSPSPPLSLLIYRYRDVVSHQLYSPPRPGRPSPPTFLPSNQLQH